MQPSTKCVEIKKGTTGSVQPIDPSTAFHYIDSGPQFYPRYFNTPNQNVVAQKIADLEHAELGLIFGSGLAATTTTINALTKPGDHALFLNGLYGGTQSFINSELADRNVEYSWAEKSIDSFEQNVRENTSVIYVESPTNPLLEIVDLRAIANLAAEHNIVTIIDNTFASPINQNPIDLGIDIVIHSGTKYLGGHSDLCCGAVVCSRALMDGIYKKAKIYGGSLNALSVYLLERSIKTLDVRVRRQNENAAAMARYLESHECVSRVYYPGLESHPDHVVAQNQMHHPGAMIAFELLENISITEFLKNIQVIRPALSLGGVESNVCVPATTSHRDIPIAELNAQGLTEQLIRFSVGIEDLDDLKNDFEKAVGAASPLSV